MGKKVSIKFGEVERRGKDRFDEGKGRNEASTQGY